MGWSSGMIMWDDLEELSCGIILMDGVEERS